MGHPLARSAISIFALGLVALHVLKPELKIDAITLGLVIVCILPWAAYLLKSAKFPGGWEVTFRDVETAVEKIYQVATVKPVEKSTSRLAPPEALEQSDANLALVSLRIEIC